MKWRGTERKIDSLLSETQNGDTKGSPFDKTQKDHHFILH